MPLSTFNPDKIRAYSGDIYVAAAPTANPGADLTVAKVLKGYFGLFYNDGDKKTSLKDGILPYCVLKADGLKITQKFKVLSADTNRPTPPIPFSMYPEGYDLEWTIQDMTRDKLAEILSATTNQKYDIDSAAGQAGKSGLLKGVQLAPKFYTLMFRSPSKDFPGEFDHDLTPKLFIDPSTAIELTKTKGCDLKVKAMAVESPYLTDPDTGFGVSGYYEETTEAAA